MQIICTSLQTDNQASITPSLNFWATVTSNGSPYATGRLSCLSETLVYCGQTVGWIKVPLGTEVGLVPGDIVLDGDQLPHGKGAQQPRTFRSMSIVTKRSPISATGELLFTGQMLFLTPNPQGHHLSSELKTPKTRNRKMAAAEVYK